MEETNQKTWKQELLNSLKEWRPTYRAMVEYCVGDEGLILNNYLFKELVNKDLYFDMYCGTDCGYYDKNGDEITESEFYELEDEGAYEEYVEIYQYYIISSFSAERFAKYTHELVYYNEDLDIYLLCVTHYGTSWDYVSSNWKTSEEIKEDDD